MDTKQTKVLVTGGAGFIGSHCVDALLKQGHAVVVFDIKSWPEAEKNLGHVQDKITYIEGDIRDIASLKTAYVGVTHVLHLAAIVSVPLSVAEPIATHGTNVTGTLHVFELARQAGIARVVYASSAAVYGDTEVVPTPELTALRPTSPYGLHKCTNEQYAQIYNDAYGMRVMGLRFFNVYGSRQDPTSLYSGVISIFNDRLSLGQSIMVYGDGNQTRDFVHVHDVAAVCVASLLDPEQATGVCNVGTGNAVSLKELIITLEAVLQCTAVVSHESGRVGDIQHSCADVTKLRALLGQAPATSLEVGLQELQGT